MKRGFVLLAMLGAAATARAEEIVLDFEQAEIGKPMPSWTDKGVVVKLAGPLTQSKAAGRIMFFPHLATNHKGILNAMATEQAIPVQVTFPESASEVTLVVWGSTGCPALVEALVNGKLAGAGLDVFVAEPRVPEALFKLDNVVLQPHVSSGTHQTRAAMGQLVVDNLAAFFSGKPLLTQV